MQSFSEFLTEGRDAPLYHGTEFDSASQIIKHNTVDARTHHTPRLLGFQDKKLMKISGVSLSRERSKARSFGEIIFEFDQAKLSQNYKIRPIQWFSTIDNTTISARTAKYTKSGSATESEEFVVGSIRGMDYYLNTLWVPKDILHEFGLPDETKQWSENVKRVLAHPKIKYF